MSLISQELKIKIAFLYYNAGLSQEEIARRLGLTRQKVNSIIGSLRDDGIVTVSICGQEQGFCDWETQLEQTYSLQRVIIADDYGDQSLSFLKVAEATAHYLEQTIQSGDTIGVSSWGRTLTAAIREMRPLRRSDCKVVQLLGAQSIDTFPAKSDDILRALSNKLDCPCYMLYAPAVVSCAQTKQLLLREQIIQRSFEMIAACDIGLFGIGSLTEDAPMCRLGFLTPEEIGLLRQDGFVADIGMNPVREDGSSSGCFLEDRLLNASMAHIRNMKNTVAMASGADKVSAVRAVLKSGCVNTLVVDSTLAGLLIQAQTSEEEHE